MAKCLLCITTIRQGENGILYQSKMRIELSKYSVTLLVRNINFVLQAV